jgi:hypothetical protein
MAFGRYGRAAVWRAGIGVASRFTRRQRADGQRVAAPGRVAVATCWAQRLAAKRPARQIARWRACCICGGAAVGRCRGERLAAIEAQRGGAVEAQRCAALEAQRCAAVEAQRWAAVGAQRWAAVGAQRWAAVGAQRLAAVGAQRWAAVEVQRPAATEDQSLYLVKSRSAWRDVFWGSVCLCRF